MNPNSLFSEAFDYLQHKEEVNLPSLRLMYCFDLLLLQLD
jgi:hypothetical protein